METQQIEVGDKVARILGGSGKIMESQEIIRVTKTMAMTKHDRRFRRDSLRQYADGGNVFINEVGEGRSSWIVMDESGEARKAQQENVQALKRKINEAQSRLDRIMPSREYRGADTSVLEAAVQGLEYTIERIESAREANRPS